MYIDAVTGKQKVQIVAALADEIWREHFTAIIGRDQVDYMLEKFQSRQAIYEQLKKGFLYYLIENDDSYVGYFGVLPEGDQLLLSKFYIRAAERGKGLGRKALGFIESLASENNAARIVLTVNKYNLRTIETYKKLGFVINESMVLDIGNGFVMDDYRMEKDV